MKKEEKLIKTLNLLIKHLQHEAQKFIDDVKISYSINIEIECYTYVLRMISDYKFLSHTYRNHTYYEKNVTKINESED